MRVFWVFFFNVLLLTPRGITDRPFDGLSIVIPSIKLISIVKVGFRLLIKLFRLVRHYWLLILPWVWHFLTQLRRSTAEGFYRLWVFQSLRKFATIWLLRLIVIEPFDWRTATWVLRRARAIFPSISILPQPFHFRRTIIEKVLMNIDIYLSRFQAFLRPHRVFWVGPFSLFLGVWTVCKILVLCLLESTWRFETSFILWKILLVVWNRNDLLSSVMSTCGKLVLVGFEPPLIRLEIVWHIY